MFSIWIPYDDPNAWKNFKENAPFGILEWEVEERTTSVNFIDLTIYINKDCKIETITYQKAINIYLYPPTTFSHPLSTICGMIYGTLRKYNEQNNHQKHYIEMTVLLFRRLAAHGWDNGLLQHIFNDTSEKVETKCPLRMQ